MKRECVSELYLSARVNTANHKPRGPLNREPSLLRRITKRALQVVLTLSFLLLMPPIFDGVAQDGGDSRPAYKLGPQDQLRVRVHEWRPSRDEIFEWKSLNSDDYYSVNLSGHIALPLLGDVFVDGMSTAELSQVIGLRLKERMGLVESPSVNVEIVKFRPFYIVGAVDKPGEYPYRPGLTVLQAYSIAGGRQRSALGIMRLEREAITTRGELQTIDLERQGLISRMARLEAELANAAQIELPPGLMKRRIIDDSVDRIVKQEELMFEMRKKTFETQLNALTQLQSYLEQAVISMQKRLKLQETQVETVQEELDSVLILFKKGLVSAPRRLALQRNLAQVGGDLLRLESTLMLARQEVGKTKIAITDLRAKRTSDNSTEMRKTQATLEELKHRTESSKQLLYETEVVAPQIVAAQEGQQLQPIYKILRQSGAVISELGATETTVVEPGDTIKVELPLSNAPVPSVEISSTPTGPAGSQHSAHDILDRLR